VRFWGGKVWKKEKLSNLPGKKKRLAPARRGKECINPMREEGGGSYLSKEVVIKK